MIVWKRQSTELRRTSGTVGRYRCDQRQIRSSIAGTVKRMVMQATPPGRLPCTADTVAAPDAVGRSGSSVGGGFWVYRSSTTPMLLNPTLMR